MLAEGAEARYIYSKRIKCVLCAYHEYFMLIMRISWQIHACFVHMIMMLALCVSYSYSNESNHIL